MRPSTSQPVSPILDHNVHDTTTEVDRVVLEHWPSISAARPDHAAADQSGALIPGGAGVHDRRDLGDGLAAVEDVNLAAPTYLTQVLRKPRLQL